QTNASAPLLDLGSSTVTAGANFIRFTGGSTSTVAGSLLRDVRGTLSSGGTFLSLNGGATLNSTTTTAALNLSGTMLNAGGQVVQIDGFGGAPTRLSLTGP